MKTFLCSIMAALAFAAAAHGQQLQTVVTVTGEAGYLTNAYLDPSIPVWERTMQAPFSAFSPMVRLSWSTPEGEAAFIGGGRLMGFLEEQTVWRLFLAQVHLERRLGSGWTLGVDGAGTDWQGAVRQTTAWATPFVRYRFTPRARLGLRGGASLRRLGASPTPELSSFALLEMDVWPGSRWHWQGSIYYGHTGTVGMSAGAVLTASYLLSDGIRIGLQGGSDQFGLSSLPSELYVETQTDRTWHGAATFDLPLSSNWSLVARAGALYAQGTATEEHPRDIHLSTGFRWTSQRTRPLKNLPRPLWVQQEGHVQFRIPQEHGERLYLVGDFNDWRQPGIPLEAASGGVYTTVLKLKPGTYQYKVQVVEGGAARWLSLPEHALTVEDGFGGVNGLLIVN